MAITEGELLTLLSTGDMEIEGRLTEASNITLRVQLSDTVRAVYKPIRGERPLWDFPDGTLAAREVAAYELSAALGWDLVPLTVMRDGPLGPGSCQLWLDEVGEPPVGFIPADAVPDNWLPIAHAEDDDGRPYVLAHADEPRLAQLALFDAAINNADRKGGHILSTPEGSLRGVDHGVCFHFDDKLRTVLWGFAGRPAAAEDIAALRRADLSAVEELLSTMETDALAERIKKLDLYPLPPDNRHAIPWPPI